MPSKYGGVPVEEAAADTTDQPAVKPSKYGGVPVVQSLHKPSSNGSTPAPPDPNASTYRNVRTGRVTSSPADQAANPSMSNPLSILDTPISGGIKIAEGVKQGMAPARAALADMGRTELAGMGQPQPGKPALTPELARQGAGAAHKVISGGFEAAMPLMVAGGVAAPLRTAATLGATVAAQSGVEEGLKALGLPEEYASVAGDLTALVAGAATHKLEEGAKSRIVKILKERWEARATAGSKPAVEPPKNGTSPTAKPAKGKAPSADELELKRLQEENAKLKAGEFKKSNPKAKAAAATASPAESKPEAKPAEPKAPPVAQTASVQNFPKQGKGETFADYQGRVRAWREARAKMPPADISQLKPPVTETKPPSTETTPPVVETPAVPAETKPPEVETPPVVVEPEPTTVDTKALEPETEPPAETASPKIDEDTYRKAVDIVRGSDKASTSAIQRQLKLGYGVVSRIIDRMEKEGIVGPADGSKPRSVIKREQETSPPPHSDGSATPAGRDAAAKTAFEAERAKPDQPKLNLRKKAKELQSAPTATEPAKPVRDSAKAAVKPPLKGDLPQPARDSTVPAPLSPQLDNPARVAAGPNPSPETTREVQAIAATANSKGIQRVRIQPSDANRNPTGPAIEMDLTAGDANTEVRRVSQALGGHVGLVGVETITDNPDSPGALKKWFRTIDKPKAGGEVPMRDEGKPPSGGGDFKSFQLLSSSRPIRGFKAGRTFTYLEKGDDGNHVLITPQGDTIAVSPEDLKTFKPSQMSVEGKPIRDRRASERGGAPVEFISAGMSKVYEKAMAKARRDPNAPRPNYSFLGALRDLGVENLSQLKQASQSALDMARRTASSRSQTQAIVSENFPAIGNAMREGRLTEEEFNPMMIQGRLYGLRDRWNNYANQIDKVTDDQADKAFEDWMGDLLGKMAGQKGFDQDLKQTAAAILKEKDYDLFREFVKEHFTEAADAVTTMVPEEQFFDTLENPGFQKALAIYKDRVESKIAEIHETNEGVFSDALGPLGYYPLTPIDESIAQGPGRRIPYYKPGNLNNRFATGLSEAYDPQLDVFKQRLSAAVWANNKASLFKTLEDEGLLHKLKPSDTGEVFEVNGQPQKGVTVEISPPRTLIKDGEAINLGAQKAVVPAWLEKELRPILAKESLMDEDIGNLLRQINTRAVKGLAEPVFHMGNIVGTIIANTPYLGTRLQDKAISLPFIKAFGALGKVISTDPATPEAARDIADMARLGLIPERYGSVTYNQRLAETTGAEKVSKLDLSPTMFGPHGLDVRARLYMYRLAKEINPNSTPGELFDVVNQLGNYTTSLQSQIERSLKRSGLSPFYTAGSTMNRNGFNAVFSTGPMPASGLDAAGMRTFHALTSGLVGTVGSWAITYKAMTGMWPWQDDREKLLAIPVSDEIRNSDFGKSYWGDNDDVGYVSLQFFNPILGRGTRVSGMRGAFDTAVGEGDASQMFHAAVRDAVNSAVHPVMGPIPRTALVGLTGAMGRPYEPYMVAGPGLLPAAPKNATAGQKAWATAKELNSFYGSIAINTGFGPQDEHDRGNRWTQMVMNMALAHLGERAPSPEKRRATLEKDRNASEKPQE